MSLQFLLDSQRKFQELMGIDFSKMSLKERCAYLKEHGYFLMEETVEMLREMPYHKSWKDYSDLTPEEIEEQFQFMKSEAIDALHFMINVLLFLDMSEAEIIEMYKKKNKLNYQRQEDSSLGYVTSTKN
jgi:hypothetical protein